MSKRIVLLTAGTMVAQAMAQRMASIDAELALIVREDVPRDFSYSAPSEFVRRILGDKFVDAIGFLKLPAPQRRTIMAEKRLQEAADNAFKEALTRNGGPVEWPAGVEIHTTARINDQATVDRIGSVRPDLLVVFGTKLLKQPLIATAAMGALNAHSSLLPGYRGLRSEFWQCFNDDRSCVGLTIHMVDPGVDSGDILFAKPTATEWPTDPYYLRMLNILSALEHYPRVVQEYLDGSIQPRPQGISEHLTYRGKDITMEKRIELMDRLMRR